jgi:L-2-hydroxyglutarate oxidase LhgO
MTTHEVDTLIIGAGVVGLAIARALAMAGREVIVVERHARVGEETSSRNSGVIHSGIYYPKDSLKARLCVRGRELLYAYCRERGVAHRQCGKLIVAQSTQISALRDLQARAAANGVTDLEWLSGDQVRAMEPEVRCAAGLFSPSTGIVDVHEYMNTLMGDIESAGGQIVTRTRFVRGRSNGSGFAVEMDCDGEELAMSCRALVNSAGLDAVNVLDRITGYPASRLRKAHYAKGNYFVCHGSRPFKHLVYPMPNEAGLGVHATLDLDGTTRFGPDVEWIEQLDYGVDARRGESFYAAIREYWPALPDGALQPGYAGIRPKLVGADGKAADFVVESEQQHGVPGLVNLLGIESPGLTASLALAEHVRTLVARDIKERP